RLREIFPRQIVQPEPRKIERRVRRIAGIRVTARHARAGTAREGPCGGEHAGGAARAPPWASVPASFFLSFFFCLLALGALPASACSAWAALRACLSALRAFFCAFFSAFARAFASARSAPSRFCAAFFAARLASFACFFTDASLCHRARWLPSGSLKI